jgi:hypothetical protein
MFCPKPTRVWCRLAVHDLVDCANHTILLRLSDDPNNLSTRQPSREWPRGSPITAIPDNRGHEDLAGSHNPSTAQPWNPKLGGTPPGGAVPPPPPPPSPPLPLTSPTLCRPLLLGAYALPSDVPLCSKVLLCDLSLLLPESDCKGFACGLWGDPGGLGPRKGESLGRGLACLSFYCASSTLRSQVIRARQNPGSVT